MRIGDLLVNRLVTSDDHAWWPHLMWCESIDNRNQIA